MRTLCLAIVLLASAAALVGAPEKLDRLTVGAITYSNVTILGANATDLYFTHQQGIGNVKLKYLSRALQDKFHYDPRVASEAERRRAEDDAKYQQSVAVYARQQAQAAAASQTNGTMAAQDLADPVSEKSFLGKAAPPLTVETWVGSKEPAIDGKFVLVTFWTPESAASRHWIPELNGLQKQFEDRLVVVGLCASPETIVTNMVSPKIEFPSAVDTKARLSEAIGVTSVPCVMLVDAKRIVRYLGHPAALTSTVLAELLPKSEGTGNGKPAAAAPAEKR